MTFNSLQPLCICMHICVCNCMCIICVKCHGILECSSALRCSHRRHFLHLRGFKQRKGQALGNCCLMITLISQIPFSRVMSFTHFQASLSEATDMKGFLRKSTTWWDRSWNSACSFHLCYPNRSAFLKEVLQPVKLPSEKRQEKLTCF